MTQATELLRSKIAYNRLIYFIFLQIAAPEPRRPHRRTRLKAVL